MSSSIGPEESTLIGVMSTIKCTIQQYLEVRFKQELLGQFSSTVEQKLYRWNEKKIWKNIFKIDIRRNKQNKGKELDIK